jgi:V8-like Glu-specific endopeptidase
MPSFLDEIQYPFAQPEAQELHVTLTRLYPSGRTALMVAQKAGVDPGWINGDQASVLVWHDILENAAGGGLLRDLVRTVRDVQGPKSPARQFLEDLLADRPPMVDGEPRNADGSAAFMRGEDTVSEPEALLFRDDLTIQIGRVPALIATLERLCRVASSVCRLVVDIHGKPQHGSAFRIAGDLLLTNWHVLHNRLNGVRATAVTAEFGYEDDGRGGVLTATAIPCDVASIVTDQDDDWAVIQPQQPLQDGWPILALSAAIDPVVEESAYIVQHPRGDRKRLGYVRNQISDFDERVLHYLTDTQEGSSGSPVFDAEARLIGLHHVGGTPQDVIGRVPISKNEGIRIPRVVAGLRGKDVTTP